MVEGNVREEPEFQKRGQKSKKGEGKVRKGTEFKIGDRNDKRLKENLEREQSSQKGGQKC